MTDKRLREIYALACGAKGFEPNESQFKIWKQILGWAEEKDLEQALVWYFTDNLTFPMPAELKALAGRAARERQSRSAEKKYLVGFQCPECGSTEAGYFPNADIERRVCNSPYKIEGGKRVGRNKEIDGDCPVTMQITHDERPQ